MLIILLLGQPRDIRPGTMLLVTLNASIFSQSKREMNGLSWSTLLLPDALTARTSYDFVLNG